ncbi:MAG: hypothetical protein IPQ23_18795 [Cytophagaceae bacterium]|nr:hypothetical protein [Cytophagaceae bacterium]
MKKYFLSLILLLLQVSLFAQSKVYTGNHLLGKEAAKAYYIISNLDDKEIKADLETFLKPLGKITNPNKSSFRVEKIKNSPISPELESIEAQIISTKKMTKVVFFFIDEEMNPLKSFDIKTAEAETFVKGFENLVQKNLELRLADENLKNAENELADAQKEIKKLEKSLENNLKEQEKLGKKLDQSPELMAKALSEKEELVEKLYSEDSTASDLKTKTEIEKASSKKEKEISKIKKEQEKAESKLEKKEADFANLKIELMGAKKIERALEIARKDAFELLSNLKK